ncbi:MAG: 30S ribosomal protein S20 [Clostridiales bacterium]|nr:30S ribosomal protein S20 [Clostridiales bacterium]
MPNIKSAKKRAELSKVYAGRNQAAKSALKTTVKKCEIAISEGSEQAPDALKAAAKCIDQAVKKGILHKNNAARKKSKLATKLQSNKAQADAE